MLPGDQEDDDVQYLLNIFVLFNILEVFAILGLAYLDHKQKERAARRTSILSIPESLDESEDEDGAAKAARAEGEDDWQAEPSADASAHSRRGSSFSRVSRPHCRLQSRAFLSWEAVRMRRHHAAADILLTLLHQRARVTGR